MIVNSSFPCHFFLSEKKKEDITSLSIAMGISRQLEIPVIKDAVCRTKKTATQTHKTRIGRWENMESGFRIRNAQEIQGKHVLLVDDVVTTGASLEACAGALLTVPGLRLSIACLAHTVTA
jgi:predicted amidophosphoribosyltransferase